MAFADNTTGGRIVDSGDAPRVKITLSGTVKAGDLIGYSSGWKDADMNSSPKVYPELIGLNAGVSGNVIEACRTATVDFGSGCTATAGDLLFASTDAGQYASSSGDAPNDQGFQVGLMLTAQVGLVDVRRIFPALKQTFEYAISSGHAIAVQLKPVLNTTGTASATGIEIAPKTEDAVAAGTLTGVSVAVDIEGTSAGTVTTARCYEANVGSDSGSGRTVTNVHCVEFTNNMHGTVTNGPFCMKVNTHGGNVAWSAFVKFPDDGGNTSDLASAVDTVNGVVKVIIGSTTCYIPTYTSYTAA